VLKVNRKRIFTTEAVLDIAHNARTHPVQSVDITAQQGMRKRYLEAVAQHLIKFSILLGTRGPKVDYRLARPKSQITLEELVRVMQTHDGSGDFLADVGGGPMGQRVLLPLWGALVERMLTSLDEITVERLCRDASRAGVKRDVAVVVDYAI
jgi:Rrf2 family protein